MLPLFDNRRPNQDSNLDALAGRDLCYLLFSTSVVSFLQKKKPIPISCNTLMRLGPLCPKVSDKVGSKANFAIGANC